MESVLLERELTTSWKENLILTSSHAFLRPFIRKYFSICRCKDHDFHVDIPKYVVMQLHKSVGLLDPTLESKLDDLIHSSYDPLRDCIAQKTLLETWEDSPGQTIKMFQFAPPHVTVADVSKDIFAGFTRSFDINCPEDFSIQMCITMCYLETLVLRLMKRQRKGS